jgi:hypothetical protein
MKRVIVNLAVVLVLALTAAQTNAGSDHPVSPIPNLASQAKADCIPCKVKCKRCFVPGRRWDHVSECYADCDAKGVKLSTASCSEYKRCPYGN